MRAGTAFFLFIIFSGLQSFGLHQDAVSNINFQNISLTAALKKAKAENKLVFVLVESKHCKDCRRLDKDLKEAGEYGELFNSHFCCIKMNGDNMLQQLKIQNWGITKVPAMVFLSDKHKVVHFAEGYGNLRDLSNEAQIALNLASNPGVNQ